jgi:hypothetical protein
VSQSNEMTTAKFHTGITIHQELLDAFILLAPTRIQWGFHCVFSLYSTGEEAKYEVNPPPTHTHTHIHTHKSVVGVKKPDFKKMGKGPFLS